MAEIWTPWLKARCFESTNAILWSISGLARGDGSRFKCVLMLRNKVETVQTAIELVS